MFRVCAVGDIIALVGVTYSHVPPLVVEAEMVHCTELPLFVFTCTVPLGVPPAVVFRVTEVGFATIALVPPPPPPPPGVNVTGT